MSEPTMLAHRPRGSQALARVEVERDVVFSLDRSERLSYIFGGLSFLSLLIAWVLKPVSTLAFPVSIFAAGLFIATGLVLIPRRWGKRRLERLLGEPEGQVEALRRLLRGRLVPPGVRADAMGWLALELLEQGELEQALEALRDPSFVRRRRATGLPGEGIRAIVGRLFPVVGWRVVPSAALGTDSLEPYQNARQTFVVIRAALRLLEAVETGDAGSVAIRWAELPHASLESTPVLATLLQAEAARIQPALKLDLEAHIHALSPAGRRLLLQYPAAIGDDGPRGYREPARALVSPSTRLVTSAGLGDVMLFLGLGRTERMLLCLCFGVLYVFPGPMAGFTVVFAHSWLSWLTGFPRALKRRDRVWPFVKAGMPHSAWLRELSHMRTRSHSRRQWMAMVGPFDHDHVMLVLGVHDAEQALLAGDRAKALESIGWWLGNLSPRGLHELDPVGLGAALLRLSALLGFDEAMVLLERLPPVTRRSVPRSGHGDAPRAMALAHALVAARRGDWSASAQYVNAALEQPSVRLEGFEHAVYGRLLRLLAKRGHRFDPAALGLPRNRHADEVNLARAIRRPALPSPK